MEHLVFTLVTFVFFTALVAVISAKIVSGDDQSTAKGYFLAGSGLGGTFIAGSMLLTNLSAENLVGLSGQSYEANMSGMAWEATAVIATIVMAFIFLPLYLKKGYTTLPEFMEERYGVGVRRMVSILFLIGYLVIGIPVCLYAGAIAFNQIFDVGSIFGISSRMALTILIVLVGVIGAVYAVCGGMKAVAVSDTLNGILLIVGSVFVVVFGFIALGKANGGGFTPCAGKIKCHWRQGRSGALCMYLYRNASGQPVLLGYEPGADSACSWRKELERRAERGTVIRFFKDVGSVSFGASGSHCCKAGSGTGKQGFCISDAGCKNSPMAGGGIVLRGIVRFHYFHL